MKKNKFMETMINTPRPTSMFTKEESIKKEIIVLDILKKWIPPLANDERELLEQNVLQHGCKDPLIIWETVANKIDENSATPDNPCFVLLDGHNRYEICQKYSLDFKFTLIELASLEKAQDFMIDHQLGRRNLSAEQMAYLRGMKYLTMKQERGKYDRNKTEINHSGQNDPFDKITPEISASIQSGHNDHLDKKEKLSEQLAATYNVGEKTIRRDADFAKGVELLPDAVRKEVLQGKSALNKKDIIALGKIKQPRDVALKIQTLLSQNPIDDLRAVDLREKNKAKVIQTVQAFLNEPEDCDELMKFIKQYKKELIKKQAS